MNPETDSNIKIIFCQPYLPDYYIYFINSLHKKNIIETRKLQVYLENILPSKAIEISNYLHRFKTFIIQVEEQIIQEMIPDKAKYELAKKRIVDDQLKIEILKTETKDKNQIFKDKTQILKNKIFKKQ
jgi:hypothetical protein